MIIEAVLCSNHEQMGLEKGAAASANAGEMEKKVIGREVKRARVVASKAPCRWLRALD